MKQSHDCREEKLFAVNTNGRLDSKTCMWVQHYLLQCLQRFEGPLSIAELLKMQLRSDSKGKAQAPEGYSWGGGVLMEMPQSVQSES